MNPRLLAESEKGDVVRTKSNRVGGGGGGGEGGGGRFRGRRNGEREELLFCRR